MKRCIFFFTLQIICLALCSQGYFPYQTQQPSEWSGTGWMLNKGYVVTNHHVAEYARTIQLRFVRGDSTVQYSGTVVAMDQESDLAIIKINDPNFHGVTAPPYAVKTSIADVGESIFVLGYPMTTTMGEEIKLTTGIVSSHSGFQGSTAQYQISAPVQPGNSGGPLFDDNGNVIGIVNAKHNGAENVSYAVKASYLKTLIDKLEGKTEIIPSNGKLAGLNLPQKVKAVKPYVCYIYCSTRGETPRSATPKYGASAVPQGNKIIELPYVDYAMTENTVIKQITITNDATIIEVASNNATRDGYFEWVNINKETKIEADGKEYRLKKADGIAIAPNTTPFKSRGETITFRLYFPPIPKGTTSINFIEPGDSSWKFYGISLKEY